MRPRRSTTTYTETLDDEACVYEWVRHEVHALNKTAASVWELCDGETTLAEMAERLDGRGLSHAEQLVALALDEFRRKHLLEPEAVASGAHPPIARRAFFRRGVTAALLPVVTSMVAPTPLQAQSPTVQTQTFSFTGAPQTFVVPAGVTALTVSAFGAGGRGYLATPSGGAAGGSVTATVAVTAGETLVIVVGGTPPEPPPFGPPPPGFNGGGRGGTTLGRRGGSGGGGSDVRRGGAALANRVVVAGGGGGAGTSATGSGGPGGATTGGGGTPSQLGGAGGSQTAGGAGGVISGPYPFPLNPATAGSFGGGGDGGSNSSQVVFSAAGGGGGGGHYGGGGGTVDSGGGGGSSFADPAATGVVHVQGTRAGDGLVVLRW